MEEGARTCTGCQQTLPAAAFGWRDRAAGRRRSQCRDCRKAYQARWYRARAAEHRTRTQADRLARRARTQALLDHLKSNPCADCGRRLPAEQMDFDHVRGEKAGNVAHLAREWSPDRLLTEIAKCELVCAVCHRMRTADRARNRRV